MKKSTHPVRPLLTRREMLYGLGAATASALLGGYEKNSMSSYGSQSCYVAPLSAALIRAG